jgi:hypothetical protein
MGEERAHAANTTNTCLAFVGIDDIERTTKELEGCDGRKMRGARHASWGATR